MTETPTPQQAATMASHTQLPIDARVLLVDDDPILCMQIKRLAERFVGEIRIATDGLEGLAVWRDWQPDVVVADIFMPGMNGLEMSAAIKAEDSNAQIIVITSSQEAESLRQALVLGVERYINKPIDIHLLVDAIAKCLRDRQHIEELRLSRQVAALSHALQEQLLEKTRTEEALRQEKAEHLKLINRLEEAHNQLLQSEKMASIGQLAAGIAHDINNPVGFVNSNLGALQDYVRGLLRLTATYERHERELSPAGQAELRQVREDIDLDFLRADIGNLLDESLGGLQRVKRIVQDLKDFSHVGDTEMQWADITCGLESTLNVVWNELKYKAEVIKDYAALPAIECIPSQLNQVFMNLLVNAAQAIPERGTITIRTRANDEQISIEIADTGAGIPPDIMNRIFDPFFTTKPVGTGTGLGLSITHGIVRKHNGRITVDSAPGQGSRFRIELPVRQPVGASTTRETTR